MIARRRAPAAGLGRFRIAGLQAVCSDPRSYCHHHRVPSR